MSFALGLVMDNEAVMRDLSEQRAAESSWEPSDSDSEEASIENEVPERTSRREQSPAKEGSFSRVAYHELCDIQCAPLISKGHRNPQNLPSGANPHYKVSHTIRGCIRCVGVLYGML